MVHKEETQEEEVGLTSISAALSPAFVEGYIFIPFLQTVFTVFAIKMCTLCYKQAEVSSNGDLSIHTMEAEIQLGYSIRATKLSFTVDLQDIKVKADNCT